MTAAVRGGLSALVILACVIGVGCESNKDQKDAEKRQKQIEKQERKQRQREQDASRDPDRPDQVIGHRADDRAGQGTGRGLDEIPRTASRVDAASGPDTGRLSYSPTRDGMLYVYDSDDDRVIYSARVRKDERFVLDIDANRATLDGRTVLGTGLNPRHRYRIYFDRGRND